MNYSELPDTITVIDYAKWRNIGREKATQIFNSRGFPKLRNVGNKLLADKRNVLLFELNISEEERKELLKEMARQII